MNRRTFAITVLLFCSLQSANALTVITTIGTHDCKTWTYIQKHGTRRQQQAARYWLYGFLSGFAMGKREDIIRTRTAPDSYRQRVTRYCAANSGQDAADAALALISDLERKARHRGR